MKLFKIALSVIMVLVLAGCGKGGDVAATTEPTTEPLPEGASLVEGPLLQVGSFLSSYVMLSDDPELIAHVSEMLSALTYEETDEKFDFKSSLTVSCDGKGVIIDRNGIIMADDGKYYKNTSEAFKYDELLKLHSKESSVTFR